jgi:plasmid stability protein
MPSITIRDVPAETRNELAARAATSGRSLQEYLRGQLIALAERPDPHVLLTRIRARKEHMEQPVSADRIVEVVRELRDS